MLEFAREHWLWTALLLALFYAAWFFARRYRKRRVTYGVIWQRVARRVLPPSWKRLLRQAFTLLIATAMLAAVVLFAAGLQRSPDDLPGPLLLVIVQDNSVSMRARHGDSTRRELANARARELLAGLRQHDRAVAASFKFGQPLLGPWLEKGAEVALPPTDFAEPDLPALAQAISALGPAPDVPARPAPRKIVVWLGDAPPALPEDGGLVSATGRHDARAGTPVFVETFGGPASNNAIVSARYTPPQPGDDHGGVVEAATLSGADPRVLAGEAELTGTRVELPVSTAGAQASIRTAGGDALPEDDSVPLATRAPAIRSVVVSYRAADTDPRDALLVLLRNRLPGREIQAVAVEDGRRVDADLLVALGALPAAYSARALLLFGVAGEAGVTGPPVNAEPNMRAPVSAPDVGLDLPDLALVRAREAVPLLETSLTPIARHMEGGVLVALQRQPLEILYCGFMPLRSTLLEDAEGLLLLVRWLEAVQQLPQPLVPPIVSAGESLTLKLPGPAEVKPAGDTGWPDAWFEPGWSLTPGPDGKLEWQAPDQPGGWMLSTEGQGVEFHVVWSNPAEQRLPFVQAGPVAASVLHPADEPRGWRDLLPGLLLWIALGLLVLEWLLWLAGLLD